MSCNRLTSQGSAAVLQDANERGWLRPRSALREQEGAAPDMVAAVSTALEIAKASASPGLNHWDVLQGALTGYCMPDLLLFTSCDSCL